MTGSELVTDTTTYRIGIDIGGTFTDVVLLNSNRQELVSAKVSTTPDDRAVSFFHGLDVVAGSEQRHIAEIVHGSTVATNAVLEGKGSRLGLITTQGFRDILEIGRAYIPGIFTNSFRWQKPERLVPLERVREVPERMAVDGSVLRPLDEEAARCAITSLLDDDIEALAIAFLHSYVNPAHEIRVVEIASELSPGLFISRSSAALPEYREYERTMTTVLNAYVMPTVDRYLGSITSGMRERKLEANLSIVRSDAGIMSIAAAVERPVNTVLSGPAGGVKGASAIAAAAGHSNIVSMDMGGTSTDVCLSTSGEPRLSTDTWVSHYPIRVPIIDITTIGAGGGSIAYVSPSGALRVGPQSAGAEPGPACYGRGGNLPTVSDANLVLGRLPRVLAGGELELDIEAARMVIDRDIAGPLGLSLEEAAEGIIRIVDENMLGALRVVSVARGMDPRELTLVPFGGAGPVHGAQLARLAGISTMLVPAAPGVLSAMGFLLADVKQVFSRTLVGSIGSLDLERYNQELAALTGDADAWLERERIPESDRSIEVSLELRYRGQAYELSIPGSLSMNEETWRSAATAFHTEHERRYGYAQPFSDVEVVTLRVTAIGLVPTPELPRLPDESPDASSATGSMSKVYFEHAWLDTPVYERALLRPGNRFDGPALVVQDDSTTVIHPGQRVRVDELLNLIVAIETQEHTDGK
jgi:N-methylhydantoinase A